MNTRRVRIQEKLQTPEESIGERVRHHETELKGKNQPASLMVKLLQQLSLEDLLSWKQKSRQSFMTEK